MLGSILDFKQLWVEHHKPFLEYSEADMASSPEFSKDLQYELLG